MSQAEQQFDDPELKTAIRRVLAQETAPPALRQRIERALAEERLAAGREQQARQWRWRNPLMGLAAAAVLLIALGLAYNTFLSGWNEKPAPRDFASLMIKTHTAYAQGANPGLLQPIDGTDLDAARRQLAKDLGYPVMVGSPGGDWKLAAVGLSKVGPVPAAQAVFKRGQEMVSVISVDGRPFYTTKEGTNYRQTQDGYQIAGFVHGNAVYCVVGSSPSGSLSLREVARIRDRLRSEVAMVGTRSPCGRALASIE